MITKKLLYLVFLFNFSMHLQGEVSTSLPCNETKTPYMSCEKECCSENLWELNADLIYWRALQYECPCVTDSEIKLNDWSVGCRLNVDYNFFCTQWGIALSWTHFNAYSHFANRLTNHGHKSIGLDLIDFTAGYLFSVNSVFSLRPYGGIEAAQIKKRVEYDIESIQVSNLFNDRVVHILNLHENFNAVGPKIGLEGNVELGCGVNLFGNLSGSVLYGQFASRVHSTQGFLDPLFVIFQNGKGHEPGCQIITDAFLGVSWQYNIYNDIDLLFKFQLEHHCFYNNADWENLYLDGIDLSLGTSF